MAAQPDRKRRVVLAGVALVLLAAAAVLLFRDRIFPPPDPELDQEIEALEGMMRRYAPEQSEPVADEEPEVEQGAGRLPAGG